jgi:hypothetical protein
MSKSFLLELCFVLICFPSLQAQTAATPAADPNAKAANPTPARQAPDEMTKKIAGLVHVGKYVEAQQLNAGLLIAYPYDQRLIKAKALIEKLLAPAGLTSAAPDNSMPSQPMANTNREQLSGMEKIDYNALIELTRQAQQTTDLPEQTKLLQQFMDQSGLFLQKHSNQMLLWQLRAASAISLNDLMSGYEAGQNLLAMGAADTNDANLQRLLAQLKNKGWLEKQVMEDYKKLEEQTNKYSWLLGTWSLSLDHHLGGLAGLVRSDRLDGPNEEFSWRKAGPVASVVEGYNITGGLKSSGPDLVGTLLDSGEIRWERYFSPAGGGSLPLTYGGHLSTYDGGGSKAYYPSGWQPVISSEIVDDKRTMRMVIPSQNSSPKSKEPWKQVVTLSFTKIEPTH